MFLTRTSRFALFLGTAVVSTVGLCFADDAKFQFALIGDMPYGPTAGGTTGVPKTQVYPSPQYNNVISMINSDDKVKFTVHIGDIKAGDTLCEDNVYTQNLALFNTFSRPLVFVPGDNEWTDCHRANNGSYDPIERLAKVRTTFYTTNQSLGISKLNLSRQSADPTMAAYVPHCPGVTDPEGCKFKENVMWTYTAPGSTKKLLFVGINQPGSNNNFGRTTGLFLADTTAEYNARNAANLAWINKAFTTLYADNNIKGIVIFYQANPFERYLEPGQGYLTSGYANFITTVRNLAKNQPKAVLLVNGDTHYYRIDKPLTSSYPECLTAVPACPSNTGVRLMNVDRAEVFAQNDVHWVQVNVNLDSAPIFELEPKVVTANVTPVP